MSIYLGTDKKILPYSKIYLGDVLKFKKGGSYIDTAFTSCPFPSSWSEVTSGTEYKASNSYGSWRIWADNCQAGALYPIKLAFDASTSSNKYYQSVGSANIGIDLPEGVMINPQSIKIVHGYLGSGSYVQGLNENGEWETLTEIASSSSNVTRTLNVTTDKYYSKFKCYLKRYNSFGNYATLIEFQITSGIIRTEA